MEWVDPPFCAGHWGPELVEIAGGFDPLGRKHQKSVQIEWEQVLKARPEVIVLALCGYDALRGERDLELLRTYPGFDTLPAARENRIHVVDANAFFARPGPRIVDSLELLAGILHPEIFPEFRRHSRRRPAGALAAAPDHSASFAGTTCQERPYFADLNECATDRNRGSGCRHCNRCRTATSVAIAWPGGDDRSTA